MPVQTLHPGIPLFLGCEEKENAGAALEGHDVDEKIVNCIGGLLVGPQGQILSVDEIDDGFDAARIRIDHQHEVAPGRIGGVIG